MTEDEAVALLDQTEKEEQALQSQRQARAAKGSPKRQRAENDTADRAALKGIAEQEFGFSPSDDMLDGIVKEARRLDDMGGDNVKPAEAARVAVHNAQQAMLQIFQVVGDTMAQLADNQMTMADQFQALAARSRQTMQRARRVPSLLEWGQGQHQAPLDTATVGAALDAIRGEMTERFRRDEETMPSLLNWPRQQGQGDAADCDTDGNAQPPVDRGWTEQGRGSPGMVASNRSATTGLCMRPWAAPRFLVHLK